MESHRFTYQANQFNGECLPCTKTTFYTEVNRASVYNTITSRQAIERAIDDGLPLDNWVNCANFRNFCLKQTARPRAGEAFAALPVEKKLQQWTNSKKMWLPDFIYGVREFAAIPRRTRMAISSSTIMGSPSSSVAACKRVSENSVACLCSMATTCQ